MKLAQTMIVRDCNKEYDPGLRRVANTALIANDFKNLRLEAPAGEIRISVVMQKITPALTYAAQDC